MSAAPPASLPRRAVRRPDAPARVAPRAPHRATLALVVAFAAGCASPSPFDPWLETQAEPASAGAPSPGDAPTSEASPLPGLTTAHDYVRLAMERNPAIRAARHRVEAARATVPQATSLDDPTLMISPLGEGTQTASGEMGLMAGVSQTFPFPGKLETRGQVAQAQVALAEATLRQVQLDVTTRVHHAWWNHRFASRSLTVVRENRTLLEQVRLAADAAYRAGRAQQQDVLRASVELAALEEEELTLRQQAVAAAAQLNTLTDRPADAPLPAISDEPIGLREVDLRLDRLLDQAATHNPDLALGRARIEQAARRLELARLERFPDLTVGVQYNQIMNEGISPVADGDDVWWLELSINLPIWFGRLDAQRTQARHEMLAELAELHVSRRALSAELQSLLAAAQTQRRLAALFQNTLTPQARQTLDTSLASYRAGQGSFSDVIQNARQLLEFRRMQDRSETDLEKQLSEIERLVGTMPPALTSGDDHE